MVLTRKNKVSETVPETSPGLVRDIDVAPVAKSVQNVNNASSDHDNDNEEDMDDSSPLPSGQDRPTALSRRAQLLALAHEKDRTAYLKARAALDNEFEIQLRAKGIHLNKGTHIFSFPSRFMLLPWQICHATRLCHPFLCPSPAHPQTLSSPTPSFTDLSHTTPSHTISAS